MSIGFSKLTDEEFEKFSKLIHDEAGIFMKVEKTTLLSNRLRARLTALNLDSFTDYYNHLMKLSGRKREEEFDHLLDVVSTNETYFFRSEKHFDALMDFCLPEIVKKKPVKKLRVWSAACSTGEEPFTLAVCLAEKADLLKGWTIEIIATDISISVLEYAEKAEYSGRRIEKVPPEYIKKHFDLLPNSDGVYRVKDNLRKMVKFSNLNFFKDPFPKDIDLLFCRNVMIYFDKEYQKRLVADFYKIITDYGYLFIGHSETLYMVSTDFEYKKISDSPVYIPKPKSK